MTRNNRNRHRDGAASIVLLLLLLQPLAFGFGDPEAGQPAQFIGCGILSTLGTVQLALRGPSTSEIKDQVR